MTSHKDYYEVLEISPHASREAIAEAYDRLSQRYQPDEDAPPTDYEKMQEIDEAFDVLDDPARRAEYDRARFPPSATAVAVTEALATARPRTRREWLAAGLLGAGGVAAMVGLVALLLLVFFTSSEKKVTLASGLVYAEVESGSGGPAHPGDVLTVHYTGRLEDGTEFDTSRDGNPIVFVLGGGQLIAGWDQGFASMKEGGRRTLTIPPGLAYGEQGRPPIIPANATLVFDVELLNIESTGQELTTDSGLKYVDRQIGGVDAFEAVTPAEGQEVAVHYIGELEDGTRFADTVAEGQPQTFVLGDGSVVEGLDEGVSTMKVGGARRLIVPPELGYGDEGAEVTLAGQTVNIPPDATLIFEVDLLDVR